MALAELIFPATDLPGAKAALVNRRLDRLLHAPWATGFLELANSFASSGISFRCSIP